MPAVIDPLEAAPAGTAATGGGMNAMMAQLDSEFARTLPGGAPDAPADPAKPAEPAKPTETAPSVAAAAPTKPADKPANDPLEPTKPAAATAATPAKPEGDMSVEDMEKFLKAHSNKKPWKVYETLKTTTAAKVAELETKLKTLEGKAVESPGDAAKIAAYEKQIAALTGETKTYKQRLAQADFKHTDAYTNLTNRANRIFQQGAAAIVAYPVTQADGTTRPATVQDLDRLRRMDPADREDKLEEMFGPKARMVARITDALDDVRAEAEAAEDEYSKNHEKTALERELAGKGQTAKFEATYKGTLDAISKNATYGKWFSPDETDPEGTKLYRESLEQLERVAADENLGPEEAAQHAAVGRAKAAAMPRVVLAYNRLEAKYKALEAELAQFRSTDPGARGATGGGGALPDNKPKGIDGAALAFDSDPGLVHRR